MELWGQEAILGWRGSDCALDYPRCSLLGARSLGAGAREVHEGLGGDETQRVEMDRKPRYGREQKPRRVGGDETPRVGVERNPKYGREQRLELGRDGDAGKKRDRDLGWEGNRL